MNLEQIVQEAVSLPEQQRRELIGRLLALGRSKAEEAEFRRAMAERIDDADPGHWISYEELKCRLPADGAGG